MSNGVQDHYDQRGTRALSAVRCGPDSSATILNVPAHLRAPYEAAYSVVAERVRRDPECPPRVFDFCCGTGIHAVALAALGATVRGVDLSTKSIEAAQRMVTLAGVESRCSLDQGDALAALRSHAADVDVVFCSGSLYYFNPTEVVVAARGALRPGGSLTCVETNGDNPLLNLWRRMRQHWYPVRDARTLSCLMRVRDFDTVAAGFERAQVIGFDFLTLLGGPLSRVPGLGAIFLAVARRLDRILLNDCGLRWLAFKILVIGEKGN
jgi:SAM-dependent methyltransferase